MPARCKLSGSRGRSSQCRQPTKVLLVATVRANRVLCLPSVPSTLLVCVPTPRNGNKEGSLDMLGTDIWAANTFDSFRLGKGKYEDGDSINLNDIEKVLPVWQVDLNCKRGDSKLEDLLEEVFDLVFCASGQRSKIRHYFGDSLT
ncbi:Uncharacterized protein KIAA0427 [Anas platyrhynchos]|uniref:Uncharacterized protein KIAA0427 n=1 Tax=Anas platyrhynchos TaxID=8839 RepID=R0L813_ANAPL|nr:Uncharacterized protein KIAA0427 [Anas platyrhynchos]